MNLIGKEVVMLLGESGVILSENNGYFEIEYQDSETHEVYTCTASPEDFNYPEVLANALIEDLENVIEELSKISNNVDDYLVGCQFSVAYGKAVDLKNYIEEIKE